MTWNNVTTAHYRWLARFLRRRGWVVFYLEKQCRGCNTECWLQLYNEMEARE